MTATGGGGAFDEFPASAQQRAIWFVEGLMPGTARYHVPAVIRLRGRLDIDALRGGLLAVIDRHEALRTGFVATTGQPRQRVHPRIAPDFAVLDAAGPAAAAALERKTALAPFDLARPPLLRVRLIRLAPDDHRLVLVGHHLVCDAFSSTLLVRDLARACAGQALAPLPIQYADYAVWQEESLTPPRIAAHLDAWRNVLEPLPEPLALPVDGIRPTLRGETGGVLTAELPEITGTTPFTVLVAGLAIVLSRLTGQEEVVIGAVAAHRDRPELAELVGCLVNTVPVRVRLDGDADLARVLASADSAVRDALTRIELPFDRLVDGLRPPRDPGRLPLCDVLATWTPALPSTVDIAGASGTVHRLATGTVKADLTVEAAGDALHVEYDRAILSDATAQWLVQGLTRVATAEAGIQVGQLTLTKADEAKRLRAAGPAPAQPPATVLERFAQAVDAHGDAVAVDATDGKRSYSELADDVARCAAALGEAGVRPGDRVAVLTDRALAWPVTVLGAMAAGAAVVPLDPAYPAARTEFMLADAGVRLVVTGRLAAEPAALPPVHPDDLAYLIYTSGSTGRPKGVAVEHASLVRLADASIDRFGLGPGDRVLQFASPAFDAAIWDLVLALLSGATLCLAPPERLAPGPILRDTLRDGRISYVLVPPSALALVPDDQPLPALRILVSGGEACPPELLRRWYRGRRFVNAYGPTEATVAATWWEPTDAHSPTEPPPLGEPLPGVTIDLLDRAGHSVPVGVPGEIYIGGCNLARGYWGRDDLTAQYFSTVHGERRYRTGDRAVRREDGALCYVGRVDDQVKIRGFRVEPAEAQHTLAGQPGIRAAAVTVRQSTDGAQLVGYYVIHNGQTVRVDDLRVALRSALPAYLVPTHLIAVDALPLTANGKLDRAALPKPIVVPRSRAPREGLEAQIAQIWSQVLQCGPVGAEDNFFDLGGHSLALAQVHACLAEQLGRELPLVDLFTHPTVASLASHLSDPDADAARRAGRERAQARLAARERRQERAR